MSSAFCSLDEAFTGPVMPVKKKKDKGRKEGFVPGPLSGTPLSEQSVPEPMGAPRSESGARPDAAVALNDFFPIPGETGDWDKAFMLEGSDVPLPRPDGAVPVAGKSTLWRQVPVPPVQQVLAGPTGDIHQRLDTLTRQLESLTTSTPMQSTAELFLFIAIGLLFLLAIDTLLRCATSIALATKRVGRVSRRWSVR